MKKLALIFIGLFSLCLCACQDDEEVPVLEEMVFPAENFTIMKGEVMLLQLEFTPTEVAPKSLTWTVENKDVVAVTESGLVTALKVGTSKVYVVSDNEVKTETTINVIPDPKEITGVDITDEDFSLYVGDEKMLNVDITPKTAVEGAKLIWKSENSEIAMVNNGGVVRAKAAGTTKITVSTEDERFSDEITVTVVAAINKHGFVISPKLTMYNLDDVYKKKCRVYVYYFHSEDEDVPMTWTISDDTKAYLLKNESGQLVSSYGDLVNEPYIYLKDAAKPGDTFTVTATWEDGTSSVCEVTVNNDEKYMYSTTILNSDWNEKMTVVLGQEGVINYEFPGRNHYPDTEWNFNKNVVVVNLDESVAEVKKSETVGKLIVTPKRKGTTVAIVFAEDTGKYFFVTIEVTGEES